MIKADLIVLNSLLLTINDSEVVTYLSPFRAHKTKDKREIDRRTIEHNPEMPDEFSDDLKDLVNGLLQKKPSERLGHNGAQELMVSSVEVYAQS